MNYKMMAAKNDAEALLSTHLLPAGTSFSVPTGEGDNFPVGYGSTTTSAGTSTTLNKTGIQAILEGKGFGVGDFIKNIDTGYSAVIRAMSTDSITTSELESGTWGNGDEFALGGFNMKLQSKDSSGKTTKFEKVLIKYVDNDNDVVYIESRAQNGTTAQEWTTSDYATLTHDEDAHNGLVNAVATIFNKLYDIINANFTFKGVKTFASFPVTPSSAPTTDYQVANRKFVLDNAGASPTTTLGDIIKRGASADERLAIGSNGQVLKVVSGEPAWADKSPAVQTGSMSVNLTFDKTSKTATSPTITGTGTLLIFGYINVTVYTKSRGFSYSSNITGDIDAPVDGGQVNTTTRCQVQGYKRISGSGSFSVTMAGTDDGSYYANIGGTGTLYYVFIPD